MDHDIEDEDERSWTYLNAKERRDVNDQYNRLLSEVLQRISQQMKSGDSK